ncbi:hypothetical protein SERLA73DRAFT_16747, partial [Serpula lacrymans var. lacrymans S7.3]
IFKPQNPEEYFNLHHASTQNIVEQIFGVLKGQFGILRYNMSIQAKVPHAVCMLHNFIKTHDPSDINTPDDI